MENMTGINETVQIVKVTYDGADRFFRVSGKALSTTKDLSLGMLKLFRCTCQMGLKAGIKADKKINESLEYNSFALKVDKDNIDDFKNYMKANKLSYQMGPVDGMGNYNIFYKKKDTALVDFYASSNKSKVSYSTFSDVANEMPVSEILKNRKIDMQGQTAIEIDKSQIVSRNKDTVRIKAASGNGYIDVPCQDLFKIKDVDTRYCIRINSNQQAALSKIYAKNNNHKNVPSGRTFKYKDIKRVFRPDVKNPLRQKRTNSRKGIQVKKL